VARRRDYTFLSGVRSIVNITGSKVYVFDDKIILCSNKPMSVRGVDPTVAICIRGSGYIVQEERMQSKAIKGIGNYCISRFFSSVFWIESTISPFYLLYNRTVTVEPVYKRLLLVLFDN
jgi:hypothetical protein